MLRSYRAMSLTLCKCIANSFFGHKMLMLSIGTKLMVKSGFVLLIGFIVSTIFCGQIIEWVNLIRVLNISWYEGPYCKNYYFIFFLISSFSISFSSLFKWAFISSNWLCNANLNKSRAFLIFCYTTYKE